MQGSLIKQAVIIGSGIAGLATAQALAPHCKRIIILERDRDMDAFGPRKGVPQSYHAHGLLRGGELALNLLFPGLSDELIAQGATCIDFSRDVHWFHAGRWKLRHTSGLPGMLQSRPLLEGTIRRRVADLSNVEFRYGVAVQGLHLDPEYNRVEAVLVKDLTGHRAISSITADLVVDASGRGSKMPEWLAGVSYPTPDESQLEINLFYSSRVFQAPANYNPNWRIMLVSPQAPDVTRIGVIFRAEGGQYVVSLGGYTGDMTPTRNEDFVEYAKKLANPAIHEVLTQLIPVTDVKMYRVPRTTRRHYEKLAQMPGGVMVIGDAMCAFDPVFGQGMSVSALEAEALATMLTVETPQSINTLNHRFHKRAAGIVNVPWMMGSTEDLRFKQTVGPRTPLMPIMHWYSTQLFELSATDQQVFATFYRVMNLLSGVPALLHPRIVFKVLKHALFGDKPQQVSPLDTQQAPLISVNDGPA